MILYNFSWVRSPCDEAEAFLYLAAGAQSGSAISTLRLLARPSSLPSSAMGFQTT
jgi:hypothetical protein